MEIQGNSTSSSSSSSSRRTISMDNLVLLSPPSLSSIASGRSSGLHPVSAQSCCMQVLAGRLAFARPYERAHRNTSLISSSRLLQQCPTCLVRLTWIVFVMGGKWPYSCCFVGCCLHDLLNIARSNLAQFPSSFFSIGFVSVHVVHSYSSFIAFYFIGQV